MVRPWQIRGSSSLGCHGKDSNFASLGRTDLRIQTNSRIRNLMRTDRIETLRNCSVLRLAAETESPAEEAESSRRS
jgi:hypothetical protein